MGNDDDHDDTSSSFWKHRNKYDLNSKIMITAIISLSIVVVLVILLHIYARCVLRRQSRRRAALRQLGIITSAQIRTSEPPKTGLDPSIIASLPVFVFKRENSDYECSICLSILEDGEMARTLPNCKHSFHAQCIDKWFSSNSTCPICRTDAEPRLTHESEMPATAPPLEETNSASLSTMEGTSDGGTQFSSGKINGSSSRLSSFRWILNGDRSSRRVHCGREDVVADDTERQ